MNLANRRIVLCMPTSYERPEKRSDASGRSTCFQSKPGLPPSDNHKEVALLSIAFANFTMPLNMPLPTHGSSLVQPLLVYSINNIPYFDLLALTL